MARPDLKTICADECDVLVVGGGIHGAVIAYHTARAGLRTVLVEQHDFCSATSANSLKILHGGLRYLQHLDIRRMRQSIISRREMMHMDPDLVQPLACLMPLYGWGMRGAEAMRVALLLNDWIGWDRNQGLSGEVRLPSGRLLSKTECLQVIPGLAEQGLRGGAVWYDALALNTERLALDYILGCLDAGGRARNYTKLTGLAREAGGGFRVTLRDMSGQGQEELHCRYIVNAAGPWFERIAGDMMASAEPPQSWTLALNLVSRRKIFSDYAVALEGKREYRDGDAMFNRGKRLYFFVPWQGRTMIGTEYEPGSVASDTLEVSRESIENMLAEVNGIYPRAALRFEDICFYHAGLLPMKPYNGQGDIQLEKHSAIRVHEVRGGGIVSVRGVKYTTAPAIAGEVLDYLFAGTGRRRRKPAGTSALDSGKLSGCRPGLRKRYGRRGARVESWLDPDEKNLLPDREELLFAGEIRYLVEEEMACTLSDIVFRRTGLGTAGPLPAGVLEQIAGVMADLLGWDARARQNNIEEVMARYAPLKIQEQ